ncbi:MAG: LolA family protein [Magnetovibrionaceae bacterium]
MKGKFLRGFGLMMALTLAVCSAGAVSAGPAPIESLGSPPVSLKPGERLEGNFEQKRFLTGFDGPLISEGTFRFLPEEGLYWQTVTPFDILMTITPDGITQSTGGEVSMSASSGDIPGVAVLYRVLDRALSGDWSVLSERQGAQLLPTEHGWDLTYRPEGSDLGPTIAELHLSGGRFLDRVTIVKRNGDRDEIRLSRQTIQKP